MSRCLIFALSALLIAAPLYAQRTTERFIPIGRSPGISGTPASVIGTIEAVDTAQRTLRIAGPQGSVTITFPDTADIWIDRSTQRQSALVGSASDLVVGRRAEVKFTDPARREVADWIKVESG
jgi:hypothetical protein